MIHYKNEIIKEMYKYKHDQKYMYQLRFKT